jgi:hypothetical protein
MTWFVFFNVLQRTSWVNNGVRKKTSVHFYIYCVSGSYSSSYFYLKPWKLYVFMYLFKIQDNGLNKNRTMDNV